MQPELQACLQSIRSQSYPREKIEIIIANRSMSVSASRIAKKFDAVLLQNAGKERSAQRNKGALTAHGKYLLFLDVDMTLSHNVISECIALFANKPHISGIYIPEVIKGRGLFGAIRNFERSFYNGTCIDAMRCIKADIFKHIGGFDTQLWGGEDWDLDRRLGGQNKGFIISKPLYHDEQNNTMYTYLQKKAYYTDSLVRYKDKWGDTDTIVQKQLGFLYRFLIVFVENKKWKKILRYPHLFLGVYSLKFFIGVTYIYALFRNRKNNKREQMQNKINMVL